MTQIKITKDGVSNNIIADMDWAQSTYPTSDGYAHEAVDTTPSEEVVLLMKAQEERMWRNTELERTDSLSLLTDYPNASALITYRQELRDWPSTDDFPDIQPTLGS